VWSAPLAAPHLRSLLLYKITVIITGIILVGTLIVMGISLEETGHLPLAAFLVFWAIVGAIIPLWLIYRHGLK
jgi:uncharacterized membrane protein YqjE